MEATSDDPPMMDVFVSVPQIDSSSSSSPPSPSISPSHPAPHTTLNMVDSSRWSLHSHPTLTSNTFFPPGSGWQSALHSEATQYQRSVLECIHPMIPLPKLIHLFRATQAWTPITARHGPYLASEFRRLYPQYRFTDIQWMEFLDRLCNPFDARRLFQRLASNLYYVDYDKAQQIDMISAYGRQLNDQQLVTMLELMKEQITLAVVGATVRHRLHVRELETASGQSDRGGAGSKNKLKEKKPKLKPEAAADDDSETELCLDMSAFRNEMALLWDDLHAWMASEGWDGQMDLEARVFMRKRKDDSASAT